MLTLAKGKDILLPLCLSHLPRGITMKSLTIVLTSILMLFALSNIGFAQTNGNTDNINSGTNSNTKTNSNTTNQKSNLSTDRKSYLKKEIDDKTDEYKSYARRWSFTYYSFVFGAAILAALAGILAKVTLLSDKSKQDTLVAILAGLAAVLPIISTAGNFNRKWQANRVAAYDMDNLHYEIEKENANYDEILSKVQAVNKSRNDTIAGIK